MTTLDSISVAIMKWFFKTRYLHNLFSFFDYIPLTCHLKFPHVSMPFSKPVDRKQLGGPTYKAQTFSALLFGHGCKDLKTV